MTARFPSPSTILTPPEAEGWQDLYPYYVLFSDDGGAADESKFWFQDTIHWPQAVAPWDATLVEFSTAALSQYNTRHYLVPPARGIDVRVLNGYVYLSPVAVTDPAEVEARVPEFLERAGFYFGHWDDLYSRWMHKVRGLIAELEALRFQPLPDKEPIEVITTGQGTGSGLTLLETYHELIELALRLWQYHFEFLNLGYAAYLDYFTFCKEVFPNISDLAVAKMVAGVEVDLFRPDDELRALARAAVELGVDEAFSGDNDVEAVVARLQGTPAGCEWLARTDAVREPWFNFSSGSGFYHSDRVWADHPSIPFGFIRDYVAKLVAGENIDRPLDDIRTERERIAAGYGELLDEQDCATFAAKLGLARTVFPFVENHNFYVEHWGHSVLWRKMRDLGRVLSAQGFFAQADDVFYLKRNEIPEVLFDYYRSWAVGVEAKGRAYWPEELERRKRILAALRACPPPTALGTPPERVTEPFTIMLWGVTSDSVKRWLGEVSSEGDGLSGLAASPGVAEGPARVISSPDQIDEVQEGEVLVAPLTVPSWAPIFSKIVATVTDVGGIMSHAAIVCREYGLPAVSGTAVGTAKIKTGQRIRVDGSAGTVTFLD